MVERSVLDRAATAILESLQGTSLEGTLGDVWNAEQNASEEGQVTVPFLCAWLAWLGIKSSPTASLYGGEAEAF